MAHYIAYKILPDLHCVVEYYTGELCLTDLLVYQKKVAADVHYDPCFNIISDFRNADIKVKTDEVPTFIAFVKKHRPVAKRQSAVLTETPYQFVIGELYKMHLGPLPMNVSVISTVDAAIQWIGLTINHKVLINNTISDLKNNNTVESKEA